LPSRTREAGIDAGGVFVVTHPSNAAAMSKALVPLPPPQ
jgi:hypothetical protein